jgi:deoxyribodipyrimidine photolyase
MALSCAHRLILRAAAIQMVGNPEVRQIPWNNDPKLVKAWEDGQTGFPWIDAIMMQLQQWGWMHHLARHSVACFLTRGDLYCHWEAGRDVFDKYLIDGDYFLNNGNWQWLSASNFFYQYFRVRFELIVLPTIHSLARHSQAASQGTGAVDACNADMVMY